MKLSKTPVWLITLVLLASVPGGVRAQESIFSLALSGGVGGSFDEEAGFSNPNFQLRFAVETSHHQYLSVRAGRIDFSDKSLSLLLEPSLDYLTIAGEYMRTEGNYESGLFLGLGLYDVSGTRLDGANGDQSTIGLLVGAVGEFDVSQRWFVYGEAAFHYVNLDAAQMYANLQVGLGFRF